GGRGEDGAGAGVGSDGAQDSGIAGDWGVGGAADFDARRGVAGGGRGAVGDGSGRSAGVGAGQSGPRVGGNVGGAGVRVPAALRTAYAAAGMAGARGRGGDE